MKLPVLVDCVPYNARLMLAGCIERHARAQRLKGPHPKPGNDAVAYDTIRRTIGKCADCEVGKQRSSEVVK